MMASPSSCHVTEKYDVFISFRGPDVRQGLLSHLKKELSRKQIDFYVDERLDKGDEISPSLLRAIEDSHISLVIFSKDYASSKWCLDELAKIMECKHINKQIVLPVFFNVDPSDVRNGRGEYGDALAKLEHELKENVLRVESWRDALSNAAYLSGFHYPTTYLKDESDLVHQITKKILEKLSLIFLPSEPTSLVGIDENIKQIQSLLSMKSSEVLFVGIWGMGGIGKTTIARAIFDKYCAQYDSCCFLNVREELEQRGLSLLREKLISELLKGEEPHTRGTNNYAIGRIARKNVLVVLDDVNMSEQLKSLVGEPICFGRESRVIITSRDKHVLTSGGVHHIHKVNEMDPQCSIKLFCLNAFNESQPKKGYEKLSEDVVTIAQGIPLALKVLGSYFHSKSVDTWECALRKMKKYPNKEIQSVLRFSYDGLDEVEKKAFLDIAFFFKDDDKDYVIRQLDASGFYGASGIDALQQKALITISSDNRIQIHDLIREMGFEIVRQESVEYPERRSRLRDSNEVNDVLRYNLGTDKVEAMEIDVSQIKDLNLKVDTFKRMPRLRFLKFYLPLHAETELPLPPNPALFWSPEIQDALLSSAWCKELLSGASDIHIKCNDYLLFEGCSDPSPPSSIEISRCEQTTNPGGMEIIMNSSIGHLNNLEFSDMDYQQLKNLPDDLLCFRCMYYLELNSNWGQNTERGKPKKHSLVYGLRNRLKLKVSKRTGQETQKPKLNILFDAIRYYRRIPIEISFHKKSVVVPHKVGGFAWFQEFITEQEYGFWRKVATLKMFAEKERLASLVLYQLSHRTANMPKKDANCIANN